MVSPIFIFTISDKQEARNFTNDVFSDHEPSWSPDSKSIYFTSEREDHLIPGQYPLTYPSDVYYESPNRDIYRFNLESNTITRITSSPIANEYYPVLTQDNKLYYISDAKRDQ